MKKVKAEVLLEINVTCPYCGYGDDRIDALKKHMEFDLRAENIDVDIRCFKCKEIFIVNEISY